VVVESLVVRRNEGGQHGDPSLPRPVDERRDREVFVPNDHPCCIRNIALEIRLLRNVAIGMAVKTQRSR
jgi:hypothetical protein